MIKGVFLENNGCSRTKYSILSMTGGFIMTLTGAIIYYTGMVLATTCCAVLGCLIGANLRKKKNAKND